MAQGVINSNPNLQGCSSYFSSAVTGGPATTSFPEVSLLITADNPTTGHITYQITDLNRVLGKKVFIIKTLATGPAFKIRISVPAGSTFSSSGTNILELDDAATGTILVFGITSPMVVGVVSGISGGGGSVNIYNADGVITDALRTVDLDGNKLFFDLAGTGQIHASNTASAPFNPPTVHFHLDNANYQGTGDPGFTTAIIPAVEDYYFIQGSSIPGVNSLMLGHANYNAPQRTDLILISDRQMGIACNDNATSNTATIDLDSTTPKVHAYTSGGADIDIHDDHFTLTAPAASYILVGTPGDQFGILMDGVGPDGSNLITSNTNSITIRGADGGSGTGLTLSPTSGDLALASIVKIVQSAPQLLLTALTTSIIMSANTSFQVTGGAATPATKTEIFFPGGTTDNVNRIHSHGSNLTITGADNGIGQGLILRSELGPSGTVGDLLVDAPDGGILLQTGVSPIVVQPNAGELELVGLPTTATGVGLKQLYIDAGTNRVYRLE